MGLDMYVKEIEDTTLLKKYTVSQLYKYMDVHELQEELDFFTHLLQQTIKDNLCPKEIQKLMGNYEDGWVLMAGSHNEYVEYFQGEMERIRGDLRELPSLPLEFTEHPPELPTVGSMYWRKANAIHNWFVQHVQNGIDDCEYYDINYSAMMRLKQTIELILNEQNEQKQLKLVREYLPPVDGFFFGGTDIDKYYFEDLENTLEWIENTVDLDALVNGEIAYVYHSSW